MKAITPFLIIGICVGMYFIYIEPNFADIEVLRQKRDEYVNVLEKTKEIKTQRDVATASYNSISIDDIDKLNKMIPAKFDSVVFANDINTIGSKYGLTIESLKVNAPKTQARDVEESAKVKDNIYKTVTVTFTTRGQYEQFVKFLMDLESSLQLVDVGILSIKSGTGQKTIDALEYELEVYTYSL